MDKFKNKYRIPSARLQSWDYGSNGAYFITICTQNREHFFGEIVVSTTVLTPNVETPKLGVSTFVDQTNVVSTMKLNDVGRLAEKYWFEIPDHFPFVELGNFVVMPNHTHGILIINKNGRDGVPPTVADETDAVTKPGGKNEKWKSNTIGSIINQYKRIVTINARKIHADFNWQSRFHDHIIRDSQSFETIQHYIINNPLNWDTDKFHKNNNG